MKHARASAAAVNAYVEDGVLHVEVRDDGVGGADRDGHGLRGLADRATALGGWLEVESPALGGTRVTATLPVVGPSQPARGSAPCRSTATPSPPRTAARKETL